MNRKLRIALWTVGGLVAGVAGLLGVGTLMLNSHGVQQRLLHRATALLSDQFGTTVSADSVSVNLFGPSAALYGLQVSDQQGRPMLTMGRAAARLTIAAFHPFAADGERLSITVERVEADHISAMLVKPHRDSVANYQFIVDSLKSQSDRKRRPAGEKKARGGKALSVSLRHIRLADVALSYQLAQKHQAATIAVLDVEQRDTALAVAADSLRFKTDNHRPRKNKGRPHRGWFDAGHLDLVASIRATIHPSRPDSLVFAVEQATVSDATAGIDVRSLTLHGHYDRRRLHLSDIAIQQGSTTLRIDTACVVLPNKRTDTPLSYSTGVITGRAILRDIARPFAPVLQHFRLPLRLRTRMSGNAHGMRFSGVQVSTADRQLSIAATGRIDHIDVKHGVTVHFDVQRMTAQNAVVEKIIQQFPVKRLMMEQLRRLGTITFKGSFDVVYKRETFRGELGTAGGPLHFQFSIDDVGKWITGSVGSHAFALGQVFDVPGLGVIKCDADFRVDISKQRTAVMRRQKGGRLPIGSVRATVHDSSYKGIHVRNIDATVESDGAVAEGDIIDHGKHRDLYCHFAYTSANGKSHLKLSHPGVKLHLFSRTPEEQQAREERRQQKAQAKAEQKAAKAQAKAEKKAAKEQAQAEKKAAKEQERQQKAQAKAEKKAAKKSRKL